MSRQYVIYSKICIICSRNYDTFRVNTVYCSKKCRNRARYLPQRIINSLIEKYSIFSTVQRFGDAVVSSNTALKGKPFTQAELEQAQKIANALAFERGLKIKNPQDGPANLPGTVIDNLKYINETDPASGGSDGFGVKSEDNNNGQNNTSDRNNSSMSVDNGTDTSSNSNESSTGRLVQPEQPQQRRGLRRLGKLNK